MSRRREERAARYKADQLVEEAAAILNGRLAHSYDPGEVPGWVRVNELAHADWDHLAGVADRTGSRRRSAWDGAVRFLAAELLAAAGSPSGLLQLQRSGLIPLELDMLAGGPTLATPTDLVQLVRHQLARARSRRTHPSAS